MCRQWRCAVSRLRRQMPGEADPAAAAFDTRALDLADAWGQLEAQHVLRGEAQLRARSVYTPQAVQADRQRILELYLNHVEWGEGVFGAEAAAQHYYRKPAARLTASEAARLAVMLPRPRYYEKLPHSTYLADRAGVISGRLWRAELP